MKICVQRLIDRYPNFLKMSKNSLWMAVDGVFRLGVGLCITGWMARYLGPEVFGAFNYALAVSSFVAFLGTFGLNEIITKNLVEHPDRTGDILGTVLIFRLMIALCAFSGCLIFVMVHEKVSVVFYMTIILCAGTMFQVFDVLDVFFQSKLKYKLTALSKGSAFVLITALRACAIVTKQPVWIFAWLGAFEIILSAVNFIIIYRVTKGARCLRFDPLVFRQFWRAGWPMGLASLAGIIYCRFDQLMIRQYLGDGALGAYTAATKITEVLAYAGILLYASAFPVIISSKNGGDVATYRMNLRTLIHWIFAVCLAVSLMIVFFAGPLLKVLYGNSFAASVNLVRVHVLGLPFISLGGVTAYALVVENETFFHFYRTVAACVFNVLGMLFVIPLFGCPGAVWVSVWTHAMPIIILLISKRKDRLC